MQTPSFVWTQPHPLRNLSGVGTNCAVIIGLVQSGFCDLPASGEGLSLEEL